MSNKRTYWAWYRWNWNIYISILIYEYVAIGWLLLTMSYIHRTLYVLDIQQQQQQNIHLRSCNFFPFEVCNSIYEYFNIEISLKCWEIEHSFFSLSIYDWNRMIWLNSWPLIRYIKKNNNKKSFRWEKKPRKNTKRWIVTQTIYRLVKWWIYTSIHQNCIVYSECSFVYSKKFIQRQEILFFSEPWFIAQTIYKYKRYWIKKAIFFTVSFPMWLLLLLLCECKCVSFSWFWFIWPIIFICITTNSIQWKAYDRFCFVLFYFVFFFWAFFIVFSTQWSFVSLFAVYIFRFKSRQNTQIFKYINIHVCLYE